MEFDDDLKNSTCFHKQSRKPNSSRVLSKKSSKLSRENGENYSRSLGDPQKETQHFPVALQSLTSALGASKENLLIVRNSSIVKISNQSYIYKCAKNVPIERKHIVSLIIRNYPSLFRPYRNSSPSGTSLKIPQPSRINSMQLFIRQREGWKSSVNDKCTHYPNGTTRRVSAGSIKARVGARAARWRLLLPQRPTRRKQTMNRFEPGARCLMYIGQLSNPSSTQSIEGGG